LVSPLVLEDTTDSLSLVTDKIDNMYNCIDGLVVNGARSRRGRDRMIVGFITTYAINAYHH